MKFYIADRNGNPVTGLHETSGAALDAFVTERSGPGLRRAAKRNAWLDLHHICGYRVETTESEVTDAAIA